MKGYGISFFVGVLIFGAMGWFVLQPRTVAEEAITVLTLDDTRPEQVEEENRILTVQIEVRDEITGEAIEAVAQVGYATANVGQKRLSDDDYTGCYVGSDILFGLTHVEPNHAYYLLVTAEGYEPWAERLVWQANRSMTIEIPVNLHKQPEA